MTLSYYFLKGIIDDTMVFATPILSNLAQDGITMTNFYAQEVRNQLLDRTVVDCI